MSLNLLEKTELWVSDVTLDQANLTEMAAAVARVLGLQEDKVMVVDVRSSHITFDITEKEVQQENLMGKEAQLLQAALVASPRKILVKRPLKGPFLAGCRPSYSLKGKAIRYDCILPPPKGLESTRLSLHRKIKKQNAPQMRFCFF